jgi:hypothetical protein
MVLIVVDVSRTVEEPNSLVGKYSEDEEYHPHR